MCERQGKEFESCAVRWGIRPGYPKPTVGPLPNGLSCSCKDPDMPTVLPKCDQNCQRRWRDIGAGIIIFFTVCGMLIGG